jgi:hypothetical protein
MRHAPIRWFLGCALGVTACVDGEQLDVVDEEVAVSSADLNIALAVHGTSPLPPGTQVTYDLHVVNRTTSAPTVVGALVNDTFPAELTDVEWSCAPPVSCGTASGSGDITNAAVTLAPGRTVSFHVAATLSPTATGRLRNSATVTPPADVADPSPGNNRARSDQNVDDTPVTVADHFAVLPDRPTAVAVLANDRGVDDTPLAIVASNPTHGAAQVGASGVITYTPNTGFRGLDSFAYTVVDADGDASTATVTMNVTIAGRIPLARADRASVSDGATVTIRVLANDSGLADAPIVVTVADPPLGTAVVVGTEVTYTPDAGFSGTDSFPYTITDADGDTSSALITMTVTARDRTPAAVDDSAAVLEDGFVNIAVLANDTDLGNLPTGLDTGEASHGTVRADADGTVTYTPNADYNGDDTFTYTITDGDGDTASANVQVTVAAVDDLPRAVNDGVFLLQPAPLTIAMLANDTGLGDGIVHVLPRGARRGIAVANPDNTITYTPGPDGVQPDSFSYRITDSDGDISIATVSIKVTNSLPRAVIDSAVTAAGTPVTVPVLANDTGLGDAPLVLVATDAPQGTVVVNADNTVTYTPDAAFHGVDTFEYTVTDRQGDASTATVTVTVTSLDRFPIARDDATTTEEDLGPLAFVQVLANDVPGDGATTITEQTRAAHGRAGGIDDATGLASYRPDLNFCGEDSWTYTIADEDGDTSTATIRITVLCEDDVPYMYPDEATVLEGGTVTVRVLDNDADMGDGFGAASFLSVPQHGTASFDGTGVLTYTAGQGYVGTDEFEILITDRDGEGNPSTVTITIMPMS